MPDSFKQYGSEDEPERFVLYDGPPTEDRIIIFGTHRNLTTLSLFTDWVADGTFRSCPSLFYQSYSFHALIDGKCVPCIYALLPNKKKETYGHFFEKLLTLLNVDDEFSGTLMIDFEISVALAFEDVFKRFKISFCFFHFSQNIHKQLGKMGLKTAYKNNKDFAMLVRMLLSLAFVPIRDLDTVYEALQIKVISQYWNLLGLLNYFEKTYLGEYHDGIDFNSSMFHVNKWNMYSSVLNDPHCKRTNNDIEGWHRAFNDLVGCKKPKVYIYVNAIKAQQANTNFIIDRFPDFKLPEKRRRVDHYFQRDQSIHALVKSYPSFTDKLQYLEEMSEKFGHPVKK